MDPERGEWDWGERGDTRHAHERHQHSTHRDTEPIVFSQTDTDFKSFIFDKSLDFFLFVCLLLSTGFSLS